MLYLHCDFTGNRKYLNVRLKGNIGFLVYCNKFIKKYYIAIPFFKYAWARAQVFYFFYYYVFYYLPLGDGQGFLFEQN